MGPMRQAGRNAQLQQGGQSLFEVLIAISISALIVGSAATAIVVSLKSGETNAQAQRGYAVVRETLNVARAYAESDWPAFYNLSPAKGTSGQKFYFANATSTPSSTSLSVETGTTTISMIEDGQTTVYTTWFTIENMYRDDFNAATTSAEATEDPSTLRVTAYASWDVSGDTREVSLSQQISRIRSNSIKFSQWDSDDYVSISGDISISSDGGSISVP